MSWLNSIGRVFLGKRNVEEDCKLGPSVLRAENEKMYGKLGMKLPKEFRIRIIYPRNVGDDEYLSISDLYAKMLSDSLENIIKEQGFTYITIGYDRNNSGNTGRYAIDPLDYGKTKKSPIFQDIIAPNCIVVIIVPFLCIKEGEELDKREGWHDNYMKELELCSVLFKADVSKECIVDYFCNSGKKLDSTLEKEIGEIQPKTDFFFPVFCFLNKKKSENYFFSKFSNNVKEFFEEAGHQNVTDIFNADLSKVILNVLPNVNIK